MNIETLNKEIKQIQINIKKQKVKLKSLIEQRNKLDPTQNKFK